MTKPMIRIHDTATGEIIDREMTVDEITQHEKDVLVTEKNKQDQIAKAEAKVALLERLGITADEAALLLG